MAELDDAPRQHCGGEGHWEAELDVVAGVVVATGEVGVVSPAVAEAGVVTPRHALEPRQDTRPLPLEEQYGLRQCLLVIALLLIGSCQLAVQENGGGDDDEKIGSHNFCSFFYYYWMFWVMQFWIMVWLV